MGASSQCNEQEKDRSWLISSIHQMFSRRYVIFCYIFSLSCVLYVFIICYCFLVFGLFASSLMKYVVGSHDLL